MHSSQAKEEKMKDLKNSINKPKNLDTHKWVRAHKSEKKANKCTPKNSHEKPMKQRNNSKN